jgi:Tol biopolymer transport system component/DNA-binding winged helix-turn-helix (wHTH) protein
MQPSASPSIPIRFGPFEVDLGATELRKRGRKVPLQDQPFKVLALLVQRPGDLVSREELQRALWPSHTFGEFDEGLNKAVQKLRQALDDSSDNPRFIETLPRRGYRFIAAVDSFIEDAAATASQPAPAAGPPSVEPIKRRRAEVWAWLLVGIVLLALLVVAGVHFWTVHPTSQPVSNAVPLTSYPGRQINPALSPDGKQVAFAWDGEKGDNFDIYVKLVNAGEQPLRLTSNPAAEFTPAWSPDGRYIAFCRELPDHIEIWMITALGGGDRKLGESAGCGGLSWSPNGKFLALVDKSASHGPFNIFFLSVESGGKQKITSSVPNEYEGDYSPHFSPDGRNIAFRTNIFAVGEIYVLPLSSNGTPVGEPRRLISEGHRIVDFDWAADSRSIVFASEGSRAGLWEIPASGGVPQRLPVAAENARGVSISRSDDRLVYVHEVFDSNIWRVPGPNSPEANAAPTRLIASTRIDDEPQFSRTGEKIAFCSSRSGSVEIWTCDREGHNPVQLTSLAGPTPGSPRWSPDGRWIAFDCINEQNYDLYVISAAGGLPRRLTAGASDNVRPSWSRDGRWIYFASRRRGEFAIWKVPAQGGGAVQVVNTRGGNEVFESPDGKSVYYAKGNEPGLWKAPVDGGEATRVLEQVIFGDWSLADHGICFLNFNEPDAVALHFFSFAAHKTSLLRRFSKETRIGSYNTSVSSTADGRWIIYTQLDQLSSDLMLVEKFR